MYLHEFIEGGSMFSEVDVNEVVSIGILVVNDDEACENKVMEVLRCCNYQVLHTGTVYDALHAIWENKERLDLVITNAQKLVSEGLAIIQNIKHKLKLGVLLIPSDERIEPKGKLFSFSAYVLNGLSIIGFDNLVKNARRMEEENVERASISNAAAETNKASSLINDAERLNQNRKAVELYGERSEDSRDDPHKSKKSRVTWTNEMHHKFLDAIKRLGYDRAVPKKIVEVMGVPGLTRENVASHLQKYRCSMRRTQETVFGSLPCISTRNELEGLGVLTSPTSSRLASFQTNLTAFPRSSYISTLKESSKLQCTSTSKDLSFASIPGRKFCTSIGGSHLSDLIGVDKLRNMTQCRDKSSKFVGYRFEGNKIDYGPIKKINTDALFSTPGKSENQSTSYFQHNPISDQNCILQQSSLLGSLAVAGDSSFQCQPVSRIHETGTAPINTSQEPDLLASYAPIIEDLLQHPPTLSRTCQQPQQISVQQSWDTSALSPAAAFVDDILQQHCSPSQPLPQMLQNLEEIFNQSGNDDDSVMNGIGNTYDQFDFPELDDTFFSQDD